MIAMRKFFLLPILFSIFFISAVSAITISPAVVNLSSVSPGDSFSEVFNLTSPTPTTIESISLDGDCVGVVVEKTAPFSLPANVPIKITIPASAYDGKNKCQVDFILPRGGNIGVGIGGPIVYYTDTGKVRVSDTPQNSGNSEITTVQKTKEQTPVTTEITQNVPQEPVKEMGQDSDKAPAPVTTTERTPATPAPPTWALILVGLGVIGVVVLVVVIWQERR